MNAMDSRFRLFGMAMLLAWLFGWTGPRTAAQVTATEEERLQILTEPEALRKRLQKEKMRPPFEFFRSQVAPFDVLPFVKANHWCTLSFELRANEDDYDGFLQTDPVKLLGMPQQIFFRRDARLLKEQRAPAESPVDGPIGGRRGSEGRLC